MSYKAKANSPAISVGFSGKMRAMLEDKIRRGREGIDLNEDKKGHQPFIVYRHFDMSDEVFDLGCKINEQSPEFDHKVWVHWMTDAEIRRFPDCVVVNHRTPFFCHYGEKYLGKTLSDFFGMPVKFRAVHAIEMRVQQ